MSYLKNAKKSLRKGFTLLEMLLVIAIIAILASIVIVAINPAKQIGDANNAQRSSDVLSILNAVHQYQIDQSGSITPLSIPEATSPVCETDGEIICTESSPCTGSNHNSELPELLAEVDEASYLSGIPVDPLVSATTTGDWEPTEDSGYMIVRDSASKRITVCAPFAENGETISVTR